MNYISDLAKNYPASGIRKMFQLAEQYDDVVNLTVGEPNFDTPEHIKESAKRAIDEGYTHYAPNAGILELRQAIADKYNELYSAEYTYENVIITVGASEAIFLTLLTTLNYGDEVIVPEPYFSSYAGQIMICKGNIVPVPLYEENGFKLKVEDLEKAITPKTKMLILNFPSNPIGVSLAKEDIKAIGEIVSKYNLIVISDEVYDSLVYEGSEFFSIAQIETLRKQVVLINSFSKTFAMTGWRIGYLISNKEIALNIQKLQEGIVSCVPTFIQKAALTALQGPMNNVRGMLKDYYRRRDILIDGLNAVPGFKCMKSPATFYAFANIKAFGKTSKEFAEELLREAKVVCVPGSAFGEMGEGYLRFTFANSDENLKEAVKRISEYITKKYSDL